MLALTDPLLPTSATERRILSLVQSRQATTQADIVAHTGLKQQTVSRTVGDLIEQGFLLAGDRVASGRRGPPGTALSLNPDHLFTLGVSIMADAVSVLLMDLAGQDRGYRRFTPPVMSREGVLDGVQQAFADLCADAAISPRRVIGIGIGITGFALEDGRRFNGPRSLDEWAGVDVAEIFEETFGLPAWADNDGNVAAAGESLVGIGRWARTFAYMYIATGFGGGLVINGQLMRGVHGNAGEFAGSLPKFVYTPPTLELLRHCFARRDEEYDTIGDMLNALNIHSPAVNDWLNRISDSLSLACSACAAIVDPQAIVIGGRVPRALAERMIERVDLRHAPRRGFDRPQPRVVPSEVTGDATALGAAAVPLKLRVFKTELF
ncbi:ROK family transcriptional regulator [Asticcacaulis sp. DW145]|uniref:ROK family transcriptional regulator n=1 Tax=Asticcacaulis currens TaxID=2984210 RepID=A0ABT5IBV8_9CAUL|nr:ROK family transcriptional regulator [Asticcacaulis currens]MDC7693681.1 ROK family transcriptional regulator [Asticcacaulis currens]BEV10349.1 ROK family transcriptional regulator [Asticcacaulis sp. DW145]